VRRDHAGAALDGATARRLALRAPQVIDAARAAAIKRNVHELDLDVDACRFARALGDVMRDPRAQFGLVRLRRARDRVGRDFARGERFEGCFSVRAAAAAWGAPRWLGRVLALAERAGALAWFEQRFAADHSEITQLALDPDDDGVRRVAYRYLAGTPLAGESVYTIAPRGPRACRLEVAFTYQETTAAAVSLLHRFGIRQHDLAVRAQAELAAARAGGRVVASTII
jgi:hypothetical protein